MLISKGFWLGKTPVTVAAYKRFTEDTGREMPEPPLFNPGWMKKAHPIVNVSWHDANVYCEWAGGRMPTEAEWEYATRGGKAGLKYPWGNEITPDRANYGQRHKGTTFVTKLPPQNAWGLHDMTGNVSEWVADWDYSYRTLPVDSPARDPRGPEEGKFRLVPGGSWGHDEQNLRAAQRGLVPLEFQDEVVGFRCAREVFP